ncbi:unnamed protein product [Rhodiola kirilowii]
MPRGSLGKPICSEVRSLPLPWSVRMKIALDAAKGLAFLHEEAEKPVIYRISRHQIFCLDADYNAKLSDLGLQKMPRRRQNSCIYPSDGQLWLCST